MAVPRLSARETAGVVADVLAPLIARGVIARRRRVEDLLDRLDGDRRAIGRLQRLRDAHGGSAVLLAIPGRDVALVLAPEDVRLVLDGSPEPFAPDMREKRAALSHFQPHGVLISLGAERAERRRFNEAVLDTTAPSHRLAEPFLARVREEAGPLGDGGALDWDRFARAWWRLVRRVVLGDGAAADHEVTDLLRRLRGDANWAMLKPRRDALRERFLARLRMRVEQAQPDSLAAVVAAEDATPATCPVEQVPQWLFAFDAAGMAAFRALALLAAHPEQATGARAEAAAGGPDLPLLRACVLESVRLWPTTPAILRDTTAETEVRGGTLPAGAAVAIFAPFFHRDGARLACADTFAPDLWRDGYGPPTGDALVPFSAGPGECPGRNLVLLLASAVLAELLRAGDLRATDGTGVDGRAPLPATLSPFRLRFALGRPAGTIGS